MGHALDTLLARSLTELLELEDDMADALSAALDADGPARAVLDAQALVAGPPALDAASRRMRARARAALGVRRGDEAPLTAWLIDVWRPGEAVGPALAMLTADGFDTVAHALALRAFSDAGCPDRTAAARVIEGRCLAEVRTLLSSHAHGGAPA